MAYDLMFGKSTEVKDNPIYILGFEFDIQTKVIPGMQNRFNSKALIPFSNPFEDVVLNHVELIKSRKELLELLIHPELRLQEKNILCQIITAITFALERDLPLLGVCD